MHTPVAGPARRHDGTPRHLPSTLPKLDSYGRQSFDAHEATTRKLENSMSDLRLKSGHHAAIMAGLAGTMLVPLVMVAPAQAATITKSQEWNDGEPTYEFPMTIVEGGVTFQRVSQTDPVRIASTSNGTHTFKAQTKTASLVGDAHAGDPAGSQNPENLFPRTISVTENGISGTLKLGHISEYPEKTYVNQGNKGTRQETTEDAANAFMRTLPQGSKPSKQPVQSNGESVWEVTWTASNQDQVVYTWTATYPSTTVTVSTGRTRWARSATYQSGTANNTNNNDGRSQIDLAKDQEDAAKKAEEDAKRRADEEAKRQQDAKALEDAKTQANQLINTVQGQITGTDASYVSDDTKSQAQSAMGELRSAMDTNDLTTISTAQQSLRQVADRVTQEIATGKGEDPDKDDKDKDDSSLSTISLYDSDDEDDPDDEDDGGSDGPSTTPTNPDDEDEDDPDAKGSTDLTRFIPIAGGALAVLAGGVIAGVIIAKKKKKDNQEDQPQMLDENGNPIDPAMAAAMGAAGAAGVAGASMAAGAAAGGMFVGGAMGGEAYQEDQFVPTVVVAPAIDELADLSLVPGYVPVVESQCQIFAYLSDDENKPIMLTDATISPADDIPTTVELPIADEDDPFIPAWVEDDGSYRLLTDEAGNVVYQTDEEGNPVLDEEGNPIPETVIPQYIIVLPAEDVERAVSRDLLVYSEDGQEIFRGEVAEFNEVDPAILWSVINEQIPEEERTNLVDEVSAYVGRLDEIDANNDAALAAYEEQRQLQLEEYERQLAEHQAEVEAAQAAQAEALQMGGYPMAAGDEFAMASFQDGGLDAMGDYGVDATSFEDVTDGISDFVQPGAEYDPMGVTSDGLNIDGAMPMAYGGEAPQPEAYDAFAQGGGLNQGDGFAGYDGFAQDQDFTYNGAAFGDEPIESQDEDGFDDFADDMDDGAQEASDDFGEGYVAGDGQDADAASYPADFGSTPTEAGFAPIGDDAPADGFDDFGNFGDVPEGTNFDDFGTDAPADAEGGFEPSGDAPMAMPAAQPGFAETEQTDDFGGDDFAGFETFDDDDMDSLPQGGDAQGEEDDFAGFETFDDDDFPAPAPAEGQPMEFVPLAMPGSAPAPAPAAPAEAAQPMAMPAAPAHSDASMTDTDAFFMAPADASDDDDDFSDFEDFDDFNDTRQTEVQAEAQEQAAAEEKPAEEAPAKPAPRIKIPERKSKQRG